MTSVKKRIYQSLLLLVLIPCIAAAHSSDDTKLSEICNTLKEMNEGKAITKGFFKRVLGHAISIGKLTTESITVGLTCGAITAVCDHTIESPLYSWTVSYYALKGIVGQLSEDRKMRNNDFAQKIATSSALMGYVGTGLAIHKFNGNSITSQCGFFAKTGNNMLYNIQKAMRAFADIGYMLAKPLYEYAQHTSYWQYAPK